MMKSHSLVGMLSAAVVVLWSTAAPAVMISLVTVGDPGNPADGSGLGSIASTFEIGEFEVKNSEWAEFLNTVDPTGGNSLALWGGAMGNNVNGGITRDLGQPDGSKYMTKSGFADKPVLLVTLYDAMRFANWLHNGQGGGDTESGAYTLLGGTPTPTNDAFGSLIERNPGATWAIQSKDEFVKAGYYDPRTTAQGGPPGDSFYWSYPTQHDTVPVSEIPPGGVNSANYGTAVSPAPNITDVGAYTASTSFYDTFDQGGNVMEWTDTVGDVIMGSSLHRRVVGGHWQSVSSFMSRGSSLNGGTGASDTQGFRVVKLTVPEPSTCILWIAAMLVLLLRRKL